MAPAYLGNMAAPFVKYWKGWNRPISERWLGAHQTVAGFLLGVIVALGTAFLQSAIDWKGSLVDYANWPALGLALGIGAPGGDALKSLVKRARGIAPGKPWVPFDQLDFAVGALALVWPWATLGWSDVLLILAFTFVADIVVNQASYRLGIRDTGARSFQRITGEKRVPLHTRSRGRHDARQASPRAATLQE